MKKILVCILMTSFMASLSYAEQTTTECEWMSESTVRNNPKETMGEIKPKPKLNSGSSAQ